MGAPPEGRPLKHRWQTTLKRAQGLGSAKYGTEAWGRQRASAAALVFLGGWFMLGIFRFGRSYDQLIQWLKSPGSASLMVLFLMVLMYHLHLGWRVIVEDYIHHAFLKLSVLFLVGFLSLILGILGTLATVAIALGLPLP